MTSELIGSALDRVVNSKTFSRSRSLQDFLTYIVNQSLEPDQNLKEYRIGVDVLNRGGAFDPAANSIVRVQAHRLRAKLADYYLHEGQAEDLRIDLTPGSYTPVIREGAVATLRALRFGSLNIDILPCDVLLSQTACTKLDSGVAVASNPPAVPAQQPDPHTDIRVLLHAFTCSHLELLLHSGLSSHGATRAPRSYFQFEVRCRWTREGVRCIAYLSDVNSKWILWSSGARLGSSSTPEEIEGIGAAIAQAAWSHIHDRLSCNG